MSKLQQLAALFTTDDKVKSAVPKSGWMSRKLWIFAGIALGVIWLAGDEVFKIMDSLIWLTAIYLIVQGLQDISADFCHAWVQRGKDRCEADVAISKDSDPPTPGT
jgi:hypothetical protein